MTMKNGIRIDSFVNWLCNNTTVDLRRHDALWQHTANIISAVATVKFHVYLLILTTSALETSHSWTTTHNSQMPKTLQNTSHFIWKPAEKHLVAHDNDLAAPPTSICSPSAVFVLSWLDKVLQIWKKFVSIPLRIKKIQQAQVHISRSETHKPANGRA